jgi:hypothetical protein
MICTHCQKSDNNHVSYKCLFLPTRFEPARCEHCKGIIDRWVDTVWFKDAAGSYWHDVCFSAACLRKQGELV